MFKTTLRKMTQFNIEIVSDTVCPWCYIGKKKLETAISQYKEKNPNSNDTFSTTWKPYYLNPDSPKTGRLIIPVLESPHLELRVDVNCD